MVERVDIFKDIAERTGGDIYLGVVGPVRTGKSTFIKRFMEQVVIPNIHSEAERIRATDELPQSASGRTIMTTEPKFVPNQAVQVDVTEGLSINVRLVDCVAIRFKEPRASRTTTDRAWCIPLGMRSRYRSRKRPKWGREK